MKRICIDAGHGGDDPGAVAGGLEEEDIALNVADCLCAYMRANGVDVVRTRVEDKNWRNTDRVKKANDSNVDVFVSIHCNSAVSKKASGFEVIHYPNSLRGTALAKAIASSMESVMAGLGIKPRSPVTKDYTQLGRGKNFYLTVIRDTKMPAVIVEIGFISSNADRESIDEYTEHTLIAEGIGEGILSHLRSE